jgi:hypothetical protein
MVYPSTSSGFGRELAGLLPQRGDRVAARLQDRRSQRTGGQVWLMRR